MSDVILQAGVPNYLACRVVAAVREQRGRHIRFVQQPKGGSTSSCAASCANAESTSSIFSSFAVAPCSSSNARRVPLATWRKVRNSPLTSSAHASRSTRANQSCSACGRRPRSVNRSSSGDMSKSVPITSNATAFGRLIMTAIRGRGGKATQKSSSRAV